MSKSGVIFIFFLPLFLNAQSNPFVNTGGHIGSLIFWSKQSSESQGEFDFLAGTFLEYGINKNTYKVRLNWIGEFYILGGENGEEQTEIAAMAGRRFQTKNFFFNLNAGLSYTSARYRKQILVNESGYSYITQFMEHNRLLGIAYDITGGIEIRMGRFYLAPLTISIQGNILAKGSYMGLTFGGNYRYLLKKSNTINGNSFN
jgi:hypothetical protein